MASRLSSRVLLALLFSCLGAEAADGPGQARDAFASNKLLGRGINLGNALDAPSEGEWGLTLEAGYFEAIRKAGFDSVRIPVRWATHTGEGPVFQVDPAYFARVDWAVDQALSRGLVAVLNIHHDDATYRDPTGNFPRLAATWRQVAARYKDKPDRLFFELLNEPNGELTDGRWQAAFPTLLASIRGSNPDRIVIIGPGHWNNPEHLKALELPEQDRKLIATFHYYNPFHFTHQGAPWVAGSDAWKGQTWTATPEQSEALRRDFAKAAGWAKQHDRPLYLGEFGAYSGADLESRARWTDAVAREAERLGISWAYWEFGSGFGAYDPKAGAWNGPLLRALIPPAGPKKADTR